MDRIESIGTLDEIMQEYFFKSTITNNYVLSDTYCKSIDEQKLFYIATDCNACILVEKSDFYKLYYFINNINV